MTATENHTAATVVEDGKAADLGSSSSRSRFSSKIKSGHLQRSAIVYVRQSTLVQVNEHLESKARQYGLASHAEELGWSKHQISVIDEDQGKSGRDAANRTGFQRLLTEVTLGHVGLVLGLEMSRLARSSKDWHHLLELCALFETLLGDQDGVYNPTDSNDRLLLGLKGTMSEFELLTMRNRLQRGLINKAERGELHIAPPIGYQRLPSGEVVLDTDEQARNVIHLIFDKFDELGTARKVLIYLVRNQLRLGYRWNRGPRRGELEWRRANYGAVLRILTHPNYAGAYVFGRRRSGSASSKRSGKQGDGNRYRADGWRILLKDGFPAYIDWNRYEAIQRRIQTNTTWRCEAGSARGGSALLAGIAVCGRCGRRLQPYYPGGTSHPHYLCRRGQELIEKSACHGTAARVIDELVVQQLHEALRPVSVELSLRAIDDSRAERKRLHQQWSKEVERARYEAQRAERQYQSVEPENRLVARTLEASWEAKLADQRRVEEEFDRLTSDTPLQLSEDERARIVELSSDVAALWSAETTTNLDRQEIVRCLIEQVTILARRDSQRCDVTIRWKGGYTSEHEVLRPVQTLRQLRDTDRLRERIAKLKQVGKTDEAIADRLNAEGFIPARCRHGFNPQMVRSLRLRFGLTMPPVPESLQPDEWWAAALAERLGISVTRLGRWAASGWCHARRSEQYKNRWVVWANPAELDRLERLSRQTGQGPVGYPTALTTPGKRS